MLFVLGLIALYFMEQPMFPYNLAAMIVCLSVPIEILGILNGYLVPSGDTMWFLSILLFIRILFETESTDVGRQMLAWICSVILPYVFHGNAFDPISPGEKLQETTILHFFMPYKFHNLKFHPMTHKKLTMQTTNRILQFCIMTQFWSNTCLVGDMIHIIKHFIRFVPLIFLNNPSNNNSLLLSHLCGDLLAYLSQVVTEENDLSGLHHVYFMMQWNFWSIDNTNAMNHIFGMFLHVVGFWFDENKTSNLELLIFEIILSVFLQLPSYHLCVWSIFII